MKRKLKRAIAAAVIAVSTLTSLQATVFTSNASSGYTPYNDVLVVRNPILYKPSSDILGNYVFSVNLAQKDGETYFYDMNRNILIGSSMSNIVSTDSSYYHDNMALLYNVGKAWDFYNDLGWDFYGSNEQICITLASRFPEYNNAKASNYGLIFGIGGGKTQNWGTDIDVVTHEFTHLVTQLKLGWDSTVDDETNCLMEAYSDIMGELNDGTREWKIGTNQFVENINNNNKVYSIRDIAQPNETITPDVWNDDPDANLTNNNFYTDYTSLRQALPTLINNSGDRTYSALGSTVISKAAYLMETNGIPAEDLKVIWYRSMDKLKDMTDDTKKATFSDCRKAVLASTDVFTGTKRTNYNNIIKNAFDEVKVYIMGDVNDDGEIDSKDIADYKSYINGNTSILNTTRKQKSADLNYDGLCNAADLVLLEEKLYTSLDQKIAVNPANASYFTGLKAMKYPSSTFWNNYYDYLNDTNVPSETECNHDNDIHSGPYCKYITINNTFLDGYNNTFDMSAEEPYYQCAGFAKKLQYEYFNTTKYLQLSNLTQYEPRVGDHLRVSYRGIANHSVFVTSVNGNTFTYADCNSSGNCNIGWYKNGIVNGDSTITLDGSTYSFSWVERPIMVGDVNGDSYVNSDDLTAIRNIILGYDVATNISTKYRTLAADINRNGYIDTTDWAILNQYLMGSSSVNLYYVR